MQNTKRMIGALMLASVVFSLSACIVAEPREGYYDSGRHRYYREHQWHECVEHDEFCR